MPNTPNTPPKPAPAKQELSITHIASKNNVKISVIIQNFDQTVTPSFASSNVYARMDPLFTYQNTVRKFTLQCKTDPEVATDGGTRDSINTLFQIMYPTFEKVPLVGVAGPQIHLMKGPPILNIKLPGAFPSSTVIVPESFALTSGFPDSEKVNYTITSLDQLRYIAPAEGYAFTLGGTILHRDKPPGFVDDGQLTLSFTKGADYPLDKPES